MSEVCSGEQTFAQLRTGLRDNTIKVNDTVNVHFEINPILYRMPELKRERGKKMRRKKVPGGVVFYMITKTLDQSNSVHSTKVLLIRI